MKSDQRTTKFHNFALMGTVVLIVSVLSGVKGMWSSALWMTVATFFLGLTLMVWLYEAVQGSNTRMNRHGLILGGFGLSMFAFSYAMVPLYHLLCHGSVKLSQQSTVLSHPVEIDVMSELYRSIPLGIQLSESHVSLHPGDQQLVYVDLENESNQPLDIHLTISTNPRTFKSNFGLVYPDKIYLEGGQRTRFPVELTLDPSAPESIYQTAILFLFQDTEGIGKLGRSQAWKKMQIKGYDELKVSDD